MSTSELKSILFGVIIFGCVVIVLLWPSKAPEIKLPSNSNFTSTDPCNGAERCIALYMAPWCPVCRQATPLVKELQAKCDASNGRVGLKVILGAASPAELKEYAASLGGLVFFDYNKDFSRQFKLRAYPSWWVWNKDREILVQTTSIPVGAGSFEFLVDDVLGVKELL